MKTRIVSGIAKMTLPTALPNIAAEIMIAVQVALTISTVARIIAGTWRSVVMFFAWLTSGIVLRIVYPEIRSTLSENRLVFAQIGHKSGALPSKFFCKLNPKALFDSNTKSPGSLVIDDVNYLPFIFDR